MNENQLKKTLYDISIKDDMRERLIARCTKITKAKKLIHYKRVLRPVYVCAIVVFFSFSTVFAFNNDFREYVISFFKSEQVETPSALSYSDNQPNPNSYICYIGHQKIEDIANIKYYELNDGALIYNGYIIGSDEYYKIGSESLLSVTPIVVNDSIIFNDNTFDLHFKYVVEDSQIQILENKSTNSEGKVVSPMWTKGAKFVWLYIGVFNEFFTCIQYNLESGEIRDIIKESGVPLVYGKDVDGIQTTLSPDGKAMLIHNFDGQAFILNTQDLSYISLDTINNDGMELSFSFIDNQTLFIQKWKSEGNQDKWLYTFSSFDLESKKEKILIRDIPDSQRGNRLGAWGSLQGMIILVEESQYVVVDPKTGVRYKVEGLTPNPDVFFLKSPDSKKIAVTSSMNNTDLGYIDMEKLEFKVFDRIDFTPSGMFWIGNSKLALPPNVDDNLLSVYEFK